MTRQLSYYPPMSENANTNIKAVACKPFNQMDEHFEKEINSILLELNRFSESIAYFGPSIVDLRIEEFEKHIQRVLPMDFRSILSKYNGLSIAGIEVFGLDTSLKGSSLLEVYEFEHLGTLKKMPPQFVPFSADGMGNHYCLDLSRLEKGTSPIVFWQHDFEYNDISEVETCNESFHQWLKEVMIGWALEEYNYDGSSVNN